MHLPDVTAMRAAYLIPTDAKIRVRNRLRDGVTVELRDDKLWASDASRYAVIAAQDHGGYLVADVEALIDAMT